MNKSIAIVNRDNTIVSWVHCDTDFDYILTVKPDCERLWNEVGAWAPSPQLLQCVQNALQPGYTAVWH